MYLLQVRLAQKSNKASNSDIKKHIDYEIKVPVKPPLPKPTEVEEEFLTVLKDKNECSDEDAMLDLVKKVTTKDPVNMECSKPKEKDLKSHSRKVS